MISIKTSDPTFNAGQPVSINGYLYVPEAVIAARNTRHEAQAELVEALQFARGLLAHSGAESGYCMCGDPTDSHNMGSGHSPVDSHVYEASRFIERIDALLTRIGAA